MSTPTKIAVAGAAGRMGRMIVAAVAREPRARLAAALEAVGHASIGADAGVEAGVGPLGVAVAPVDSGVGGAAVLISFTTAEGVAASVRAARAGGAALVLGSTGIRPEDRAEVGRLSEERAVVLSSNMSPGVNALLGAVEMIARALPAHRLSMEETHHVHKKDAPSGTALMLAEAAGRGRGRAVPREEIVARREGEVIGDHVLVWEGPGERIDVRHHAVSREVFAAGALRAALWAAGKASGLYTMADVLGIAGR